jgi:hypothetical protein
MAHHGFNAATTSNDHHLAMAGLADRKALSRRSPRFTLPLMAGLIMTLSACGTSRIYWRNIDPNRSAYLQVDDAQCKMYCRANSSKTSLIQLLKAPV